MTNPVNNGSERADAGANAYADAFTGSYIALLSPDDLGSGMSALATEAGISLAEHVSATDPASMSEALAADANVVLEDIGVAVITPDPDQHRALVRAATDAPQVLALERERYLWVSNSMPSADYVRGYQAGVNALAGEFGTPSGSNAVLSAQAWDESRTTWGLQATKVTESCHTGAGIRVAVLDTGMDLMHRDFTARKITPASFIAGEEAQDGHGHGTHCIGTACGPKEPTRLPRYGIAADAEIFAGKVLNNTGRGADRGILAGINWAVSNNCQIISMSLGSPTQVGGTYSRVYEAVARRALAKGTLIIAAAGNDSRRPGITSPVGHPANCPSILAVAALAQDLTVSYFSCAGLNPDGGQVDIAAPGVDVVSSWPEPTGYRRLSGTSMATPHVAGVLALIAEANPDASPAELKNLLLAYAQRLALPATDVGSGLADAR